MASLLPRQLVGSSDGAVNDSDSQETNNSSCDSSEACDTSDDDKDVEAVHDKDVGAVRAARKVGDYQQATK